MLHPARSIGTAPGLPDQSRVAGEKPIGLLPTIIAGRVVQHQRDRRGVTDQHLRIRGPDKGRGDRGQRVFSPQAKRSCQGASRLRLKHVEHGFIKVTLQDLGDECALAQDEYQCNQIKVYSRRA